MEITVGRYFKDRFYWAYYEVVLVDGNRAWAYSYFYGKKEAIECQNKGEKPLRPCMYFVNLHHWEPFDQKKYDEAVATWNEREADRLRLSSKVSA